MPLSDAPSSLALDDIMLIEDDDEGHNSSELAKISDIQDQLQKQAEIIRDLLVQRDFLITQILQERERWQAERDGWDRTSEALIRRARKENGSVNEEELTHRCAISESDNKVLKDKLNHTQARLTDLETELARLKPLLIMQLPLPPRQDSTRSAILYPYPHVQSYTSPLSATMPYAPFPLYNTTPTPVLLNKGRKRKRDEYRVGSKGKRKEATNDNGSESNVDGDSDAEALPTPAAAPASKNPYAYMNDLYRQATSPSKAPNTPTPLKPLNTLGPTAFATSSPSGSLAFSHYGVSYSYPYPTSPFSKPSSSTTAAALPTPGRSDDAERDGSQGDTNTDVQELSEKPQSSATKSAPGSVRRVGNAGRRSQQQGKHKATTVLSDARAEHLLLAARKIGWERATAVATLVRVNDKPPPEETKNKARDSGRQTETATSRTPSKRSAFQRSGTTVIQTPSSPTPRRIHGSADPILTSPSAHLSSSKMTPSRTRSILLPSTRSLSSISGVKANTRKLNTEDHEDTGSGQTPLDSLLSAARTMMSEDGDGNQTGTVQGIKAAENIRGANEETNRSVPQSQIEQGSTEEGTPRRKRRRNAAARGPVTPRPRASEKQKTGASISGAGQEWDGGSASPLKGVSGVQVAGSTPSGSRTKSALDVLADQAAAACDSGTTMNVGTRQGGTGDPAVSCNVNPALTYSSPLTNEGRPDTGPLRVEALLRDQSGEAVQVGMTSPPQTVEKSVELERNGAENFYGTDQDASEGRHRSEEVNTLLPAHIRENDTPTIPVSLPSAAVATSASEAGVGNITTGPTEASDVPFPLITRSHTHATQGGGVTDPSESRPNLGITITESGAESEGDMDAEGDIDPDSHEASFASSDI